MLWNCPTKAPFSRLYWSFQAYCKNQHYRRWPYLNRWTDLTVSASSAMLNPKINSSDTNKQIYYIIKQKSQPLFLFLLYSLLRMMMLCPRKMFRGSWSSVTSKGKAFSFFSLDNFWHSLRSSSRSNSPCVINSQPLIGPIVQMNYLWRCNSKKDWDLETSPANWSRHI